MPKNVEYSESKSKAIVPKVEYMQGMIVLWSGALADIPNGWHLCDGTEGTPDLREKFILGVPPGENPGATGGANTHQHTVDVWATNKTGTILDEEALSRVHITDQGGKYDWAATEVITNGSVGKRETTTSENNVPAYYKLAFIMKL